MESEEEEVPDKSKVSTEKEKEKESPQKMEIDKSDAKKAPGIALPITEMTDDWMDDDVAIGSIESDDEEETPHTDQGSTEETKIEEAAQQSDTNKSEEKKAPGITLPITEMTDDWMDDGAAFGSMESEDEDDGKEEVQATNCPEETIPEKPKPSGINLPIGEMTDDWMDGNVAIGSIESEDEEFEETKTTQDVST